MAIGGLLKLSENEHLTYFFGNSSNITSKVSGAKYIIGVSESNYTYTDSTGSISVDYPNVVVYDEGIKQIDTTTQQFYARKLTKFVSGVGLLYNKKTKKGKILQSSYNAMDDFPNMFAPVEALEAKDSFYITGGAQGWIVKNGERFHERVNSQANFDYSFDDSMSAGQRITVLGVDHNDEVMIWYNKDATATRTFGQIADELVAVGFKDAFVITGGKNYSKIQNIAILDSNIRKFSLLPDMIGSSNSLASVSAWLVIEDENLTKKYQNSDKNCLNPYYYIYDIKDNVGTENSAIFCNAIKNILDNSNPKDIPSKDHLKVEINIDQYLVSQYEYYSTFRIQTISSLPQIKGYSNTWRGSEEIELLQEQLNNAFKLEGMKGLTLDSLGNKYPNHRYGYYGDYIDGDTPIIIIAYELAIKGEETPELAEKLGNQLGQQIFDFSHRTLIPELPKTPKRILFRNPFKK